ncbi:MAG TPA: hypothetical protein VEP71_00280 [Gallionella sp.]|nr:hypothetical protein [Gallionella sp.]
MKTRLGIFAGALLLLPLAGLLLSGREWDELAGIRHPATSSALATLATLAVLLGYVLLVNLIVKMRTGNNPFTGQRNYFLSVSAAGAVLGWLLAYLNLFAASWSSGQGNSAMQLLLCTLMFALLAPAVLITRALLGSFTGLLKRLARGIPLPLPGGEFAAYGLLSLVALGLLGGAVWPARLFWLLWAAPLLLLGALQLLWHESTVFSGLKSGDWGRVVCAALSGMVVGNLAVISHQAAGSGLTLNLPHALLAQLGYALFGLLCLQLGDIIAESWRGKQRSDLFHKRKKFPIPVVAGPATEKKD